MLLSRYKYFILADTIFTKKLVAQIDVALNAIQDDPYYRIIPLCYFENMTMEAISLEMNIHIRTVKDRRKRLLRKLAAVLFSDDVINSIYND